MMSIKNDMWRDLLVSSVPEEEVLRHRYNPHKRQWLQDRVRIKIEPNAFNRGAMRECFRLKKLSTFSRCENWNSRACNYVAKKYIEEVDPSVYFEDVRLQMNAKLWAQEYNRHQPPKKVDIMQMCVIEFINREDSPLYHLEHHIEGDYVKYNSNSGFVDEKVRQTPHALSHFTFERSGHQLIVVDIQGVDDIYTDPQIHTASGTEYGDGNLGVRGMALFFQSHVCNEICSKLGLSSFDLSPSERMMPKSPSVSDQTCVRGDILLVGSPPVSPLSIFDSGCSTDEDSLEHSWTPRRRRNTSGDYTPEEDLAALSAALKRRDRPSCVQGNLLAGRYSRSRSDSGSSDCSNCVLPGMPEVRFNGPVLGRIHHEMARLHDSGRFASEEQEGRVVDWEAAVYHEELSAQLGVVEAAVNLARLHLGLPADCLQDVPVSVLKPEQQRGLQYLTAAAKLGDRPSMLQLAKAYDSGICGLEKDWDKAAHFYHQAISMIGQTDREGGYDSLDTPTYLLSARLAELYMHGGHGLDADPAASYECYSEAAETALEQGNGKLATKYFMLAEEASALIPDE